MDDRRTAQNQRLTLTQAGKTAIMGHMKKLLAPTLVFAVLTFSGCAGQDVARDATPTSESMKPAPATATEEASPAPDLSGSWKQSNSRSDVDYMTAVVADGVLTVNWVLGSQDIDAIFWVGTYEAPSDDTSPYTWTSIRDAEATQTAILASTEETKDFTYEDDTIAFDVSLQGESATVELRRG